MPTSGPTKVPTRVHEGAHESAHERPFPCLSPSRTHHDRPDETSHEGVHGSAHESVHGSGQFSHVLFSHVLFVAHNSGHFGVTSCKRDPQSHLFVTFGSLEVFWSRTSGFLGIIAGQAETRVSLDQATANLFSEKVSVSQERVSGFPEKGADLRGSPGTSGEVSGTSGEVSETSGEPLVSGRFHSEGIPGKLPKNFRGSSGNFRGSPGTSQKLGGA